MYSGFLLDMFVRFFEAGDCENILGHSLHNETWLKVKPRNPLPWNEVDVNKIFMPILSDRFQVQRIS